MLSTQLKELEEEVRAADTERARAVTRLSAAVAMVEQGIKQRLETSRELTAQAKVVAGVCGNLTEILDEMTQMSVSSALARPDTINASNGTGSSVDAEGKQNVMALLQRSRLLLKELKSSAAQAAPKRGDCFYRFFTGEFDLTFFQEADMFRYKEDYEKHKQLAFIPGIAFSVMCLWNGWDEGSQGWPLVETGQMVFLVLYYSSLIARETVLKANGSKIKAWWAVHHKLTLLLCAVVASWPKSDPVFMRFRREFYVYCIYTGILHVFQSWYQMRRMHALRLLGRAGRMDLVATDAVDQVRWSHLGLFMLLPFLFFGQLFQLYHVYSINTIVGSLSPPPPLVVDDPQQRFIIWWNSWGLVVWQAPCCALLFLILGSGNLYTTLLTVAEKWNKNVYEGKGADSPSSTPSLKSKQS